MPLSQELREQYESAKLVCLTCEGSTGWTRDAYAWYYGPDGRRLLRDNPFNADPAYWLSFLSEWVCSECGATIDVPEETAEHARHIALLRSVGAQCGDEEPDW
jgi:hypothetical protein